MHNRLQFFVRLVEAGSYTKAAKDLHLSQPALSIAIQKLERELDTKLIIRSHRSFKLTEAGRITYSAAKDLDQLTDKLKLKLAELAHQKPSVAIGMIDSIAYALISHGDRFAELDNHIKLSLSINDSSNLIASLLREEIDIAVVAEQTTPLPPSLVEKSLSKEPLVIVTHTSSLEAVKTDIKDHRINNFLSYNQGSNSATIIERTLANRGVEILPVFYSTSPEMLLRVVLAKRGTAVLPYVLCKQYLQSKELSIVKIGKQAIIDRGISLVTHANQQLSPLLIKSAWQVSKVHDQLRSEIAKL